VKGMCLVRMFESNQRFEFFVVGWGIVAIGVLLELVQALLLVVV